MEQLATAGIDVRVAVAGPCATATASLMQSVADGPVRVIDVASTVMGVATFSVDETNRLLLFGAPGADRGWGLAAALSREADVVVFVVDHGAAHTHAEAGVSLRSLAARLRVPLVVAVNHCDDPARAHTLAASLGAPAGARVVGCQLIDPRSGREVLLEALQALLSVLDETVGDRQVA